MTDQDNRHYNPELDRQTGLAPKSGSLGPWYLALTLIPAIGVSIWAGVSINPLLGLLLLVALVFAVILPFYPG